MELSPEEYGAYWAGSVRISVGVVIVIFGYRFVEGFLVFSAIGPTALGVVLFAGIVLVGTFVAILGFARVVRTAVGAEVRG